MGNHTGEKKESDQRTDDWYDLHTPLLPEDCRHPASQNTTAVLDAERKYKFSGIRGRSPDKHHIAFLPIGMFYPLEYDDRVHDGLSKTEDQQDSGSKQTKLDKTDISAQSYSYPLVHDRLGESSLFTASEQRIDIDLIVQLGQINYKFSVLPGEFLFYLRKIHMCLMVFLTVTHILG